MPNPEQNSKIIKELSAQSGFDFCGISKADFLEDQAPKLEQWLNNSYQGEMKYLENYFDKRLDPRLLVPGAKTVVSLMANYYPEHHQNDSSYKFGKYAYGKDYHDILKTKCADLMSAIRERIGNVEGRAFVDSAPVMERAWAEKSGIGWIGKHGLIINKQQGSFFFLAELIIDLECSPDGMIKDYCGTCNKCVDACPTEAILPGKTLDASKCISYLTIELKSEIPEEFNGKMNDWVFGCDICQDVCPWNRFSKPHQTPLFDPTEEFLNMDKTDWEEISAEVFQSLFKGSAVKRTGFKGLSRNIKFAGEK